MPVTCEYEREHHFKARNEIIQCLSSLKYGDKALIIYSQTEVSKGSDRLKIFFAVNYSRKEPRDIIML